MLRALGYETADLSGNEMAKLHVRHMVGGRAPDVAFERVCRFEFPERPGALLQFLDALAAAGTSACSTTAITAPTSGASWPRSKCRRRTPRHSRRSSRDSTIAFSSTRTTTRITASSPTTVSADVTQRGRLSNQSDARA